MILVPHLGRWDGSCEPWFLWIFPLFNYHHHSLVFSVGDSARYYVVCLICWNFVCVFWFINVFLWFTGWWDFAVQHKLKQHLSTPLTWMWLLGVGRVASHHHHQTRSPSLPMTPSFLFSHMSLGSCDCGMHSVFDPSWCYCQTTHTHTHTDPLKHSSSHPWGSSEPEMAELPVSGQGIGISHVFIDMWVSVKAFKQRISAICFPLRHCCTYAGCTKEMYS